jgi:hypothetical protein
MVTKQQLVSQASSLALVVIMVEKYLTKLDQKEYFYLYSFFLKNICKNQINLSMLRRD